MMRVPRQFIWRYSTDLTLAARNGGSVLAAIWDWRAPTVHPFIKENYGTHSLPHWYERWGKMRRFIAAMILLGAVIGLMVALNFSTYSTTATRFAVVTGAKSPEQLLTMNTLLVSQSPSYAALASTSSVLQPVIDQLHLQTTPSELASRITTEVTPDSLLISIKTTDPDANQAVTIANAVAASLSDFIPQVVDFKAVGVTLKFVEVDVPQAPTTPTNPRIVIDVLIGAALGGLLGYLLGAFIRGSSLKTRQPNDAAEDEDQSPEWYW